MKNFSMIFNFKWWKNKPVTCLLFSLIFFFHAIMLHAQSNNIIFKNTNATIDERVTNLLQQLTIEEKISLLGYQSKSVPRLGIPAYNWWNEALHGVARAGNATVFPQAIGMAASFNDALLYECANTISTEARAKYNLSSKNGGHLQYLGLTFWSPNINIFRDPRWGRGQETYGEDPFLTAAMGTAFVKGLQGNDSLHLKAAACAKHFAVHSGPEKLRHEFDAIVDEKDLRETYLYAFKKLVNANVESVMCAYNRVNGEPCCTGRTLLQTILRNEWDFKGHVVTDCWALEDIYTSHKSSPDAVSVAAAAIKAGVNLDCSTLLQDDLMKAIQQNLLTENDIDHALTPTLRTEIKLGFFDDAWLSPYKNYNEDSIANNYHRMLSRKMAAQSMVLLKNENNILPLNKNEYRQIMIVGPNAASLDALLGNYHGLSNNAVTFVEGIINAVGDATRVEYDMGCNYTDTLRFGGIWAASNSDIIIAVLGLTPVYEGEEGDAFLSENGADRKTLSLPAAHIAYLKALKKETKTPIILVINSGSDVDVATVAPYVDAIILAWYPGEEGGNALADILFGKISPSGHLPITFYNSLNDLPDYDNYAMQGRTYRYFKGNVQYPFGFGLSYTKFDYSWANKPVIKNDRIYFSVNVKNSGKYTGDEVVQVYIEYPGFPQMPLKELKSFKKLTLEINEVKEIAFAIPIAELKKWDLKQNDWKLFNGEYKIFIGSNSSDQRLVSNVLLK